MNRPTRTEAAALLRTYADRVLQRDAFVRAVSSGYLAGDAGVHQTILDYKEQVDRECDRLFAEIVRLMQATQE